MLEGLEQLEEDLAEGWELLTDSRHCLQWIYCS